MILADVLKSRRGRLVALGTLALLVAVTGAYMFDGYDTFPYWPAHDSLTHQTMY